MPNRWVVRENVLRYRKQLETETDPEKRRTLENLLAEHEAQLLRDRDVTDKDDLD
ncbi:MAG TPA: hypothetical protein VID77_12690 [Stellaceae bacterium]|jgi:hypothetical protein